MPALLGCIADDLTGATDLAGHLAHHGLRTVQMIGVPRQGWPDDVDAVVAALKSRTIAAEDAVRDSLDALAWLRRAGVRQVYFKYCSTFDSTPHGNIGPVAEALMAALQTDFTIACPAFPATRRTVYQGHLFVGGALLSESGMQHHPLTPMTDANLVRVLQAQVSRPVGLVDDATVAAGAEAIRARFDALRTQGCGFAVVDAISDDDLRAIAEASVDLPLITAASGIGQYLPVALRHRGLLGTSQPSTGFPRTAGRRAVLAGSCSRATREQVAAMRARHPSFRLDPIALADGRDLVCAALKWAQAQDGGAPLLIYSTASPDEVKVAQDALGIERAAGVVEDAFASIAKGLMKLGVRQLIVAGGETAGAVVHALGVRMLRIGPEIDPGVPWTAADTSAVARQPLALALKSGNFGSTDFFLKAWSLLP